MEARYLFEWLRNGLDVNFSSKSWRDLVKTLIVKILRICQYIIWSGFITDLVNNSQVLRRISFLNQWTNFQFCSQLGKTKNPFLDAKAPLVQNTQLLFLRVSLFVLLVTSYWQPIKCIYWAFDLVSLNISSLSKYLIVYDDISNEWSIS